MVIADIGAGTGFFALPFARAVGSGGAVWAIDLQPEMLRLLEEKLRREGDPENIRLLEGDAGHTGIAEMELATWRFWRISRTNWTTLQRFWRKCAAYCAQVDTLRSSIGVAMRPSHLDHR